MALMQVQHSFLSRNSLYTISRVSSICSDSGPSRTTKELKEIFCTSIKVVLTVVNICCAIRRYVSKPETLGELNHYSKDYEFSTNTLVFNKCDYSKSSSFKVPL